MEYKRYYNFMDVPMEVRRIPDKFLNLRFINEYDKKLKEDYVNVVVPVDMLSEIYTDFNYFCGCGRVHRISTKWSFGKTVNELIEEHAVLKYSCDDVGVYSTFKFSIGENKNGKASEASPSLLNMHD